MTRGRALRVAVGLLLAGALVPTRGGDARAAAPAAGSDTAAVARVGIPEAMAAAARKEWVMVDVRPVAQRSLGHIQGDVHIPLEQLAARQAELDRGRKLVFYCSCVAEELALDAARVLIAAGNPRVGVLVGGYDAWRAAGGPFAVDATWEETFHLDDPPSGWGKVPIDSSHCRYSRDATVAARGTASACVTCVSDSSRRGFAGFVQRIDARTVRGRPVTFSAQARSEAVVPGAVVWVGAEDPNGRVIAMNRAEKDALTGTQEWRAVEVTTMIPREAARVLIGMSLIGAGRVWLDDARLVAPEGNGLPRVRLVVENSSFED